MQSSGTVKIFDGFYIGDQHSARDQQFLLLNHVGTVFNLTQNIQNYYEHYDIIYYRHDWNRIAQILPTLCSQIHVAQQDQTVLIHGLDNLDESASLCTIFLMHKFRWSLFKTLQFLQSRIPQLSFSPPSFQLLKSQELLLLNQNTRLTYNWNTKPGNSEELVIRNTYINCNDNNSKFSQNKSPKKKKQNKRRVTWKFPNNQQPKLSSSQRKSFRDSDQSTQNGLKNRIILNVRKILSDSSKKQTNSTNRASFKCFTEKTQKQQKLTKLNENTLSLKKYKSSYSLASLASFQNIPSQPVNLPTVHSLLSLSAHDKTSQKLQTERSQIITQTGTIVIQQGIKTQTQQKNIKLNTQTSLLRRNSQRLTSCISLQLQNEKQNINRLTSKLSLRKPTQRIPLSRFNKK